MKKKIKKISGGSGASSKKRAKSPKISNSLVDMLINFGVNPQIAQKYFNNPYENKG